MQNTYKIIFRGRVQGVGFRPFVHQLATNHRLEGKVFNNKDGVVVFLNSTEIKAKEFIDKIIDNPPPLAIIINHSIEEIIPKKFKDFKIETSKDEQNLNLPLTPDFAICKDCEMELNDKANRRYAYAFTTCINCGPRYSITLDFPFERENTSLLNFKMCEACLSEYKNPSDRRFHSQTNSCPQCGIRMQLLDSKGKNLQLNQNEIIHKAANLLKKGKIVAIKNTNGYLLCCDANNFKVIQALRERKNRPQKPFAVMVPNVNYVMRNLSVTEQELQMLQSEISPIVIVSSKNLEELISLKNITPNLNDIGLMLPNSALMSLIMSRFDNPIIATSGNIHGSPIISDDKEAIRNLTGVADYFLQHNLQIEFPQDDSVVRFVEEDMLILRRSRGFAPNFFDFQKNKKESILAMGSDLKSTFAFLPNDYCYLSQYFGNLENFDVLQRYKAFIEKFIRIFDSTPGVVLIDKHPHYISNQYGKEIATNHNAELIEIQHHKAHFASVLGEHNLFNSQEKVLGVIWDGLGLDEDGSLWGGEFFKYEDGQIIHTNQFEQFHWIAGDKMSKEPRLSLLSLLKNSSPEQIKGKFTDEEFRVYMQLLKSNTLKTSSVGRLFDAVASALNLTDYNSYEGEAAMLLEALASTNKKDDVIDFLEDVNYSKIPSSEIIMKILKAINKGKELNRIAMSFIYTLAVIIVKMAVDNKISIIACSGGVFQNAVLIQHLRSLTKGRPLKLKFNRNLSSNDENLSMGQLYYYQHIMKNQSI